MLIGKRNEESKRSKSFESSKSKITTVRNTFKQTKIQMDSAFVKYLILQEICDFWNEGTFTLASSVQEAQFVFKWNDLQSLGKTLVDL